MLYVFHVDTGRMMTFDMSLALERVADLMKAIEQSCQITTENQVLLVSGGASLEEGSRVCSYSAGTDTNPIFLFSKTVINAMTPPNACADYPTEYDHIDFTLKVREAQDLPAVYDTLVRRANLAQQMHQCAAQVAKNCETLVHDQHLQQQGWAAVVANLEDLTVDFRNRSQVIEKYIAAYLKEHTNYMSFLEHFEQDLQTLGKIPIIPALLEGLDDDEYSGDKSSDDIKSDSGMNSPKMITLLEWISAKDNKATMEILFEHCSTGLNNFDEKTFKLFQLEIENVLDNANQDKMKEVRGLGDRLFGLEQLMHEAKKYVKDQAELAQSFVQNQARASNIGDRSILPDLCYSHRQQLLEMLKNHEALADIRRRCRNAKEELCINLYQRLKWIMFVENAMCELSQKSMCYHDTLKKLRHNLEILQQLHLTPNTYFSAVTEVVRRRSFSQAYLLWASDLSCYLMAIRNDEETRRKEFQSVFEGHFLNALFPGMTDLPPSFATQPPSIFDSSLPKITVEDVEQLKQSMPDMAEKLSVPDMTSIINFFLSKSVVKADMDKAEEDDNAAVEEKLVRVVNEVGLASTLDQNMLKPTDSETCLVAHGLSHLKDLDKGCESETDTEEFEKVCQSPMELQELQSPRPRSQDASTLTEDNLQTSRAEHDRLQARLVQMGSVSRQAVCELRNELRNLKLVHDSNASDIEGSYKDLKCKWENLVMERDAKEREIVHRLTVDHEMQLADYKKLLELNKEEIHCLREENFCVNTSLKKSSDEVHGLRIELERVNEEHRIEVEQLRNIITKLEADKEKVAKDLADRLAREHKADIENMRKRFRLMTESDRSPSDTSLEKIEKIDSNHEMLIAQLRENCSIQVEEVRKVESLKYKRMLQESLDDLNDKHIDEKCALIEEISKRIAEEKDKQIETLRNREAALNLEVIKYKTTIQQLTECQADTKAGEQCEKVDETLQRQNSDLEKQMAVIQGNQGSSHDMAASVAVFEGAKVDAATSPLRLQQRDRALTRSQASLIRSAKLCIETCNVGEAVLIVWDEAHENYVILQEGSPFLHFVNSDYLDELGIQKPTEDDPRVYYCTAVVQEKEYCHAKKSVNRYNVPKGTKFYRVKVRPMTSPRDMSHSHSAQPSTPPVQMTQSQTVAPSTSTEGASTSQDVCHSLPTSPTRSQLPDDGDGDDLPGENSEHLLGYSSRRSWTNRLLLSAVFLLVSTSVGGFFGICFQEYQFL